MRAVPVSIPSRLVGHERPRADQASRKVWMQLVEAGVQNGHPYPLAAKARGGHPGRLQAPGIGRFDERGGEAISAGLGRKTTLREYRVRQVVYRVAVPPQELYREPAATRSGVTRRDLRRR